MKYFEVAFHTGGGHFSCNIIEGETGEACRAAAEAHAQRYNYEISYFMEIDPRALEYNRKPVWNAASYATIETQPAATAPRGVRKHGKQLL